MRGRDHLRPLGMDASGHVGRLGPMGRAVHLDMVHGEPSLKRNGLVTLVDPIKPRLSVDALPGLIKGGSSGLKPVTAERRSIRSSSDAPD